MSTAYDKPVPRFYSEGAKEFYAAAKRHELHIQRCADCETFRFPPQRMCASCHSSDAEWAQVRGTGTIRTFTIIRSLEPRAVPMFSWPADGYPIVVIIVELSDAAGVHVVSNIVNCDPEEVRVGMEVEVVFDDVTDEITLPKFRPRSVSAERGG